MKQQIPTEKMLDAASRAYFNMLTAGENDPAVIRFAPAVITFCLCDIKNVIRYFACQVSKMNNAMIFV